MIKKVYTLRRRYGFPKLQEFLITKLSNLQNPYFYNNIISYSPTYGLNIRSKLLNDNSMLRFKLFFFALIAYFDHNIYRNFGFTIYFSKGLDFHFLSRHPLPLTYCTLMILCQKLHASVNNN